MSELEAKVDELNGRIAALLSDKAAMDSRIGILNRVLRMREEHIELLQRKVSLPSSDMRLFACCPADHADADAGLDRAEGPEILSELGIA